MGEGLLKDGIAPGRLAPEQYAANFSDLHPPLDRHEAFVVKRRDRAGEGGVLGHGASLARRGPAGDAHRPRPRQAPAAPGQRCPRARPDKGDTVSPGSSGEFRLFVNTLWEFAPGDTFPTKNGRRAGRALVW